MVSPPPTEGHKPKLVIVRSAGGEYALEAPGPRDHTRRELRQPQKLSKTPDLTRRSRRITDDHFCSRTRRRRSGRIAGRYHVGDGGPAAVVPPKTQFRRQAPTAVLSLLRTEISARPAATHREAAAPSPTTATTGCASRSTFCGLGWLVKDGRLAWTRTHSADGQSPPASSPPLIWSSSTSRSH